MSIKSKAGKKVRAESKPRAKLTQHEIELLAELYEELTSAGKTARQASEALTRRFEALAR
jgi:hypothetical protein